MWKECFKDVVFYERSIFKVKWNCVSYLHNDRQIGFGIKDSGKEPKIQAEGHNKKEKKRKQNWKMNSGSNKQQQT